MISFILLLFLILGAVSAQENSTEDVASLDIEEPPISEISDDIVSGNQSEDVKTSIKSTDSKVIKGEEFKVTLSDENGKGLSNKTVNFELENQKSSRNTDNNGVAKLKINLKAGTYTVKYSFNETGFVPCEGETKITVIVPVDSKIKASNYVAYQGIKNKFTVTLTANGKALAKKVITFKINGKTISKKTDSKGKASINIDLKKGTYWLKYAFAGEEKIRKTSGSVKVTVKKGAALKMYKLSSSVFRKNKVGYFKIKLVDVKGNLVTNKKVYFKVNGKTYLKKTNKKGIASVKIKLKLGSYKVKVTSKKTSIFKRLLKTYKIKVKPRQARNNGMWILSSDMKSVNFTKLEKYGTKHVFVNAKCIEKFGKTYVEKWVKDAKSHGIKTHIWMQVFYSAATGWVSPVKNGKINYDFINSKISQAKDFAKIKGIGGVHFDYLRFPGGASGHANGVKAINYFTKKASSAVHKVNKKLIVSAAVMPEPSSMKSAYGQDIPTMSKYLDAILPMVYKGNYHASSNWIKQVTKIFAKQSKKAKIWTGLQTYKSDENTAKLSAGELMHDADMAALGGAYGVILFRYGLFNYINFNEV